MHGLAFAGDFDIIIFYIFFKFHQDEPSLILLWLLYVLFPFFYGIIRGFTQFCIVNNTLMYIINNILVRISLISLIF